MLISVCIPHYNRSKYLLAVLESIRIQDHPDVEVIISDDCSTDDSADVIPRYVSQNANSTKVRFHYIRQSQNLGYDGNLRAALGSGHGDYLIILGNDDALSEPHSLSRLAAALTHLDSPDIAVTNFHPHGKPSEIFHRAKATRIIGSGADVALSMFRSFSFVGGLVFKRRAFEQHDTNKYDGTVYCQIYLAARIIAAGGMLATIAESTIAKDVEIPNEVVNSYRDVLRKNNLTLHAETGGLDCVGLVASEAILPYVPNASRQRFARRIYGQLLGFTYPNWLLNYRRQKVYRAAVNLAVGCIPTRLIRIPDVAAHVYCYLFMVYAGSTAIGLLAPVSFLKALSNWLRSLSKTTGSRRAPLPEAEAGLPGVS